MFEVEQTRSTLSLAVLKVHVRINWVVSGNDCELIWQFSSLVDACVFTNHQNNAMSSKTILDEIPCFRISFEVSRKSLCLTCDCQITASLTPHGSDSSKISRIATRTHGILREAATENLEEALAAYEQMRLLVANHVLESSYESGQMHEFNSKFSEDYDTLGPTSWMNLLRRRRRFTDLTRKRALNNYSPFMHRYLFPTALTSASVPMVFLKPTQGPVELKGKALIVPVVSTANVSQLAADLLIASLSLQRVGIFDSGFLVPVVGSREDGPGVCTPLELYGRDGSDVVVVQQRSPVLKSCKHEFIDALLQFIESSGVASVLFLSGVDLSNRTDAQMVTGPSYQLRPTTVPLSSTPLARLETLPIPVYSSPVPQNPLQLHSADESESEVPFIPGGSLTRRILQTISKTQSTVPTAAILQFVLEGDNRVDAALLASVVVAILGITVDGGRLIEPQSWKQGLFGAPPDQTLYG